MTEVRYMISDVSNILDISTNDLRELEYCLSLNIKRTEFGYRYYHQEDINLLRNVRDLQDKGFHLRVIKSILPYADKVNGLKEDELLEVKQKLEDALGLSGLEAQEKIKAKYGKAIVINLEEGDFVYQDPSTKQLTRFHAVNRKPKEVKIQPITREVGKSKSSDEVAAATAEKVFQGSHRDEEARKPSVGVDIGMRKDSFDKVLEESNVTKVNENRIDENRILQEKVKTKAKSKEEGISNPKVMQINDLKQARACNFMGAKKYIKLESFQREHSSAKVPQVKLYEERSLGRSSFEDSPSDKRHSEDSSLEREYSEESSLERGYTEESSSRKKPYEESSSGKRVSEESSLGKKVSEESSLEKKVAEAWFFEEESFGESPRKAKGYHIDLQEDEKPKFNELIEDGSSGHVKLQSGAGQMVESKSDADKIVQFREIMCSIVMEALRKNNQTLTNDINDTVTQSIVKEMDYLMRAREERQEERFRQLDRTIRETQQQRQQTAVTKEGKKKKPSKFFQKYKVRI